MAEETVKQAIARYWGAMATTFDDDLLHTPATEGELRAWDRLIARLVPPSPPRDVLDVGTGTGFLALEFARRGHRATGIDLAPEMVARAREKAAAQGLDVRFLEGDAEAPDLPDASFDLVISRHLLWTLPHPDRALAAWVRLVRPGGRVVVIDGQWSASRRERPVDGDERNDDVRSVEREYGEDVTAALPFYGGAPAEQVEEALRIAGLHKIERDMLEDLVTAQVQRMRDAGREPIAYIRYAVWGERPA
jgi:ubiquinone/menaquinone biosynthesis C-methylase UbiE